MSNPTFIRDNKEYEVIYSLTNYEVWLDKLTKKYCIYNKFIDVIEKDDVDHYLEAVYTIENFDYAIRNKTYVVPDTPEPFVKLAEYQGTRQ